MITGPVLSLWALMASWYTPTFLFLLLNLVVGSIFLTSRFTSRKHPPQPPRDNYPTHHLFRAPSLLLDRVKSINFNLYRTESSDNSFAISQHFEEIEKTQVVDSDPTPTHQLVRTPSLLDRVKSIKFPLHIFENTEPEPAPAPERTDPDPVQLKVKAAAKIKKSASAKYGVGRVNEEENVERRRPETMRERGKKREEVEEECVNEKADDFINRFRQQLKLQRLDSLLQYKEYIQRGSSR